MPHYHVLGEPADLGRKPTKRDLTYTRLCRCEEHIAESMKATRLRPDCPHACHMCRRIGELAKRFESV